jgi:CRISPR-associated protein Csx10
MNVYLYDVTLEEPALVTRLEGEPNSSVAYGFLPGSVLRGALIQAYLRQMKRSGDRLLSDEMAKLLFFSGQFRYLNGYLVCDGGSEKLRSLPVPASWHQDKVEARTNKLAPVYDFAVRLRDDEDKQWKTVSNALFCVFLDKSTVKLARPQTRLAVHTARDRDQGRATRESGAVFRYESLAAGQTFRACVVSSAADAKAEQTLIGLLNEHTVMIGGSRTGGYGRARLARVECDSQSSPWRESGRRGSGQTGNTLVVTCLSDALLRDEGGQCVTDAVTFRREVLRALGVADEKGELARRQAPAFMRTGVVGGFNRAWGLPLPQTQCVQMGSVIMLDGVQCTDTQFAQLEQNGIGERRIEGFGRVAVNWHAVSDTLELPDEPEDLSEYIPVTIDDPAAKDLARAMAQRMLRRHLDSALSARASRLGAQIRHPSVSQLARLQGVIRDELQKLQTSKPGVDAEKILGDSQKRMNEYFTSLEKRQTTRTQFSRDWVDGRAFMTWLRDQVKAPDGIWASLQVVPLVGKGSVDLVAIGSEPAVSENAPSRLLAYEYALRLIFNTLALAAKNKRQQGESR